MKPSKYLICLSVFFCCNAIATSKQSQQELKCPYILPPEKELHANWVILGEITSGRIQLRQMNIIDGNATEEKRRVLEAKERFFSEEMFDEWQYFKDRSETVAEYDEDHAENALKCTYGKTIAESNDESKNVVLLIPLPVKKPVICLLVRRDVDPTHEISCKVK